MELTPEIVAKVHSIAKKLAFKKTKYTNCVESEDIAQNVLIRMSNYTEPVANLSSFIRSCVHNEQVNMYHSETKRSYKVIAYDQETSYSCHIKIDENALSNEYTEILKLMWDSPKQLNVFLILIQNPDTNYKELARKYNMEYETFKANIFHIKKAVRNSELYKDRYVKLFDYVYTEYTSAKPLNLNNY